MRKTLLLLTLIILSSCISINENSFRKLDKLYSNRIIGTWIVDASKHTPIPVYIEYFKDGTSTVYFYEDFNCKSKVYTSKQFWKIYNGYLYYKEINDEIWSEDKIIEIKKDSYIMQSDKLLYRKRGSICKTKISK